MGYIDETDIYYFRRGAARRAYSFMGCRRIEGAHRFCVWAPNASAVFLIGDFNNWDPESHAMEAQGGSGLWALTVKGLDEGARYKYRIVDKNGNGFDKADPYAYFSEHPPGTASVVCDLPEYGWGDDGWFRQRSQKNLYHMPFSIYEVHTSSFVRKPDGCVPDWRGLADKLIPWVLELGFTHVELMPVTEFPFDGSWGYQTTGYFSPTARHGSPEGLMYFVDSCHKAGLGVILDWVPSHFPKDAHGLWRFDGTPLYEHPDPRLGEQPQWETAVFDFGRDEVRSFLISSAVFWLDKYHFDGLRLDAVSSMLYRTFGREGGEWLPGEDGSDVNRNSVEFIRLLSETVKDEFPGVLLIAEESTAWPKVTGSVSENGLGFSYKWNMGWMNDILKYIETPFENRPDEYGKLTFTMHYSFSENYILPFSHDETVHGKKTLLNRMPGAYGQKFAGLRALLGYMYAHPGGKLIFMGTELAPFMEWRYYEELEWHLLRYPIHDSMRRYLADLNRIYKQNPPLWDEDHSWEGFEWVAVDDNPNGIVAFMRKERAGGRMLAVFNFMPENHYGYRLYFTGNLKLDEIFNSDRRIYGGSGMENGKTVECTASDNRDKPFCATIQIPPLSALYFKISENGKNSNKDAKRE
jgi:1,4-alpha-glucan branching enzyme